MVPKGHCNGTRSDSICYNRLSQKRRPSEIENQEQRGGYHDGNWKQSNSYETPRDINEETLENYQ